MDENWAAGEKIKIELRKSGRKKIFNIKIKLSFFFSIRNSLVQLKLDLNLLSKILSMCSREKKKKLIRFFTNIFLSFNPKIHYKGCILNKKKENRKVEWEGNLVELKPLVVRGIKNAFYIGFALARKRSIHKHEIEVVKHRLWPLM